MMKARKVIESEMQSDAEVDPGEEGDRESEM